MLGEYEVRVGGGSPYAVELRFHELIRSFPDVDDDPVRDFLVTAHGERVDVQVSVRTLGDDGLPRFLSDLAEDFRGWTGVRSWRSFERELAVSAEHSGRCVHLTWRLYGPAPCDGWHFETTTDHAPGEGMRNLARDVATFFGEAEDL
jgi:hypothetical protein